MRSVTTFLFSLAVLMATAPLAEAQQRRRVVEPRESVPVLRIRPRSLQDTSAVRPQGFLRHGGSAIGSGAFTRVPCDISEAATPVPFVGALEDLVALCPGDLKVQLYLKQARLARPTCSVIEGYGPNGRLASVRWCPP